MAQRNIFYSWQTDSGVKLNRNFIGDCLTHAIKKLNREDLSNLVIDRDTKNVPGMPDIGHTILEKIAKSVVVVADLTLINPAAVRRPDERPVSNPNVVFELGYAFGKLGSKAIVGVFNTAFGSVEELPFDLRPKRLMTYCYAKGDDKTRIRAGLIDKFADAIKQSLGDTEEEQIIRNSEIHKTLSALRLFGTEIKEWCGIENLPNVIKGLLSTVQELLELMTHSGSTNAAQSMVRLIIRDLEKAATLAINEENWPTITQMISSKGELAGLLLDGLGYKIDQGYHDQSVRSLTEIASKLDSQIDNLQRGQFSLRDFETMSMDLRKAAFLPLNPQHPQFAAVLMDISLDFRRHFLQWMKNNPNMDEAIGAVRDVRDRLVKLIAKYGCV